MDDLRGGSSEGSSDRRDGSPPSDEGLSGGDSGEGLLIGGYLTEYLADLDARLRPMPKRRRGEALAEARAHLEALMAAECGRGEPAADVGDVGRAAARAVSQFGPAEEVAGGLLSAWERERAADRRSLLLAAAAAGYLLLSALPPRLWAQLLPFRVQHFQAPAEQANMWAYLADMLTQWLAVQPALVLATGLAVGAVLPRRSAAAGVAWGLGVACACTLLTGETAAYVTVGSSPFSAPWYLLPVFAVESAYLVLVAWVGATLTLTLRASRARASAFR